MYFAYIDHIWTIKNELEMHLNVRNSLKGFIGNYSSVSQVPMFKKLINLFIDNLILEMYRIIRREQCAIKSGWSQQMFKNDLESKFFNFKLCGFRKVLKLSMVQFSYLWNVDTNSYFTKLC